jgi:hypothetical protein
MMRSISLIIVVLFSQLTFSQTFTFETVTALNEELNETSGLIWLEDRLISHNDSGDDHFLYEVDTLTGEISRQVVVVNAASSDWEDICADENYIYIGDFGNNAGTRTDLRIYRVSIESYLSALNDTVYCDTILFNYSDQLSFEPATYTTNFDAEALIAYNDSLYIFTKNWGNYRTNIYSLPKSPGTYSISKIDSIDTEGLVTGAVYNPESEEIILTGYTIFDPFIYYISEFSENNFSYGSNLRIAPSFEGSIQIEGIAAFNAHQYYVSSEKMGADASILHRLTLTDFAGISQNDASEILIYPNPIGDFFSFKSTDIKEVNIFTTKGELVLTSNQNTINTEHFQKGTYFVQMISNNDKTIILQIVK